MREQKKKGFHRIILTVLALKKKRKMAWVVLIIEVLFISLFHMFSKHFDTDYFSDRLKSYLTLSQLPRNNDDNNVNHNTLRNNTVACPALRNYIQF